MNHSVTRPQHLISPTIYQIGTAVGLLSLTFFFGALILAFGLRIEQDHTWERFRLPNILWLSTVIILISSWTLEASRRALRRAWVSIYRGRIAATLILGFFFLFVQFFSASDLIGQGVGAAANPHGSAFYMFMGIHGAHLTGGMIWLGYLYARAGRLFRATETDLRQHRRVTAAAAMYWHFMGALWLVLFFFLHRWTAA
jgi:cytochrome c oxidase subunit III